MSRPIPLPVSPHLRQSHVLKMLNEEGQEISNQQWPPTAKFAGAPRPHDFLSKCSGAGGKTVAWPPHLDYDGVNEEYLLQQDPSYQKPVPPEQQQGKEQNDSGPNLTTTYPSGFKLREEAPMSQPGAQVVPSQPAFKISKPMKMRGDNKWPPTKPGEEEITQDEVREFIRPKKANRDYSEFFAQNALPNNYPGYRAPPGTQHHADLDLEPEE